MSESKKLDNLDGLTNQNKSTEHLAAATGDRQTQQQTAAGEVVSIIMGVNIQ